MIPTFSTKQHAQIIIQGMKRGLTSYVSWKWKLKWDATTHLLKEVKPKILVILAVSEDTDGFSFITEGNVKADSPFGNQLSVSYKATCTYHTIQQTYSWVLT
jgi:hypothetical protein